MSKLYNNSPVINMIHNTSNDSTIKLLSTLATKEASDLHKISNFTSVKKVQELKKLEACRNKLTLSSSDRISSFNVPFCT